MRFSIVVSACGRDLLLKKAIESVLAQDFRDFEVIVVDDASLDSTMGLTREFNDMRIKYLRTGKRSGLSVSRNLAMRKACGEYIIFIDDDAALKGGFLTTLNGIICDTGLNVFSPKIVDPKDNKPFVEFSRDSGRKLIAFFDFNCFRGGAHVIKKAVFDKIGDYDERFGVGAKYHAAEESDYFFRLKQAREKVLYCPELVILHPREENPSEKKVFNYSYGIAAMLTKHLIGDLRHSYIYFWIILRRILISLLRALQYDFFPNTIAFKNQVYKYRYFFKGTLSGIYDYIKLR